MHPNRIFRAASDKENINFARQRSFGSLVINAQPIPLISHIPFTLANDGRYLEAHLVKSNPMLHLLDLPTDAVFAVNGGDAYISPDWYEIDNQVPTWNYIAVHLQGKVRRLEENKLPGILDRLSANFENQIDGKKPWTSEKLNPKIYENLKKVIAPIAMDISSIQGTWKLSQNKPTHARINVSKQLTDSTIGLEIEQIIKLMRDASLD